MPNIRLGAVVLSLTMLSGCPGPDDPCSPEDGAVCQDGTYVLYCQSGTFSKFKCAGELGCATNATTKAVICDFRGASKGDACPALAVKQNIGFCGSSEVLRTCSDTSRTWVETRCSSCSQSGIGPAQCTP